MHAGTVAKELKALHPQVILPSPPMLPALEKVTAKQKKIPYNAATSDVETNDAETETTPTFDVTVDEASSSTTEKKV